MDNMKNVKFDSDNFSLIELAEGVYGAIEKGGNAGSNAGIIDLGNYTVIFDTFLNIDASRELMEASEMLTGKKAGFVINSHSHMDHIVGNCIFPDNALVISSKQARELIETAGKEFEAEKEQYIPRLREVESLLETTRDSIELGNLNNELKFLENLVKPGIKIRIPDMAIEGKVTIQGSKRSLQLIQYDAAHSPGDVAAYLPEDEVCFMGDLLFAESHPWIGSGNPEKAIDALAELLEYDIKYFVPGHGRLSTKEDVISEIKYLKEIIELVKNKNSLNEKEYFIDELSPMFREWKSLCFQWNIKYLVNRMKNNQE